jgi:hypothetical protein
LLIQKEGEGTEKNSDFIGAWVPTVDFAPLSAILPVLSYLFQLFYPGCGKIWSIKGKLSGNQTNSEMPPLSSGWIRSFKIVEELNV